MVKIKEKSGEFVIKSPKTKFNKNRSFSGVEVKKSPKSRRKSLAAVLPIPKKQEKPKKIIVDEWIVNEADTAEESVSSTPRVIKKKNIKTPQVLGSEKKRKVLKEDIIVDKSQKFSPKRPQVLGSEKKKKVLKEDIIVDKSHNVSPSKTAYKDKPTVSINDSLKNLEEKFDIKFANIKKAVRGVIKFHSENPKLQNQLFEESVPLFLQICCHKIPKGNPKILRIPLPNSVITADDDICLIVPEVKGVKNLEHEKHVEHYEELLRNKGVENIKKIMTFHEFRTENETFEQKSRLADLYDVFLVDGRICGKVVGKCGNIFYKKRKVPIPVKLQVTKLKEHLDKAMSKVFCHIHLKGDSFNVQFGHNKMEVDDLSLNVLSILDVLSKEFPGGFKNVKGLYVRIERAPSVPIYVSFANPKDIEVSRINSEKPKAYKSYKDELTTLPDGEVTVRPSGRVLVTRVKHVKDGDDVITDADIIKANKSGEEEDSQNKKKKKRKQTEVAGVVNKKRKTEINPKGGKQPINGEVDRNIVKKNKKSKTVNVPERIKKAPDSETSKETVNVAKKMKAAQGKVEKKKKLTVLSVSKTVKNVVSGGNFKKKSKKVDIAGNKQKNKEKTKKNKFTI